MTVTASGGGVTHSTNVSLTVPQTNVFGIAPPDHVVIVIEENHSFASIIGSSSAPYINSLAQQGALFTQSFGVEHPSQPNYLDLFSGFGGLTKGIQDAGFTTIMAANHDEYKVQVHEANHPDAEHWIADLVDPWALSECN